MKGLTDRQQQVLDFIIEYRGEHGYSPSYADVGDRFNIKTRHGAKRHLDALEKKGFIRRTPHIARSITLLPNVH